MGKAVSNIIQGATVQGWSCALRSCVYPGLDEHIDNLQLQHSVWHAVVAK